LKNRYERVLAGQCHIEVKKERLKSNEWGNTRSEYPDSPDFTTGQIVLLPLIENMSPEEALAAILFEEIGYSTESPEPDWVQQIEMPFVEKLTHEIFEAEVIVSEQREKVEKINAQINEIKSFRRLLYGTGSELENIVRKSLERLGSNVSPAKYSQEEYILEIEGQEFLMEVKGVAKSISLTHLRQLNDYMLKYQEETGKECKGILFGNPWRSIPPELRGTEETPIFPDNVVKRAEQLNISLVSSIAFFSAFVNALKDASLSRRILLQMTTESGVIEFS
jgi:hypothetical protein